MLADLDLLLIYIFCVVDDLLPKRAKNARRSLTDAEVVTLAAAQAIVGLPSDHRFIATTNARPSSPWCRTLNGCHWVLRRKRTPGRRPKTSMGAAGFEPATSRV